MKKFLSALGVLLCAGYVYAQSADTTDPLDNFMTNLVHDDSTAGSVYSIDCTSNILAFSACIGGPITTGGILTIQYQTQSANTALLGPTSGAAALPGFRLFVPQDLGATTTTGYFLKQTGAGTMDWAAVTTAPTDAQYWTGASDATLSAEKNLGALATGLVINTAGVPTALSAQTCTNQFVRSYNASGTATCASVVSADITDNTVAVGDLAQVAAYSGLGNATNATANVSAINVPIILDRTVGSTATDNVETTVYSFSIPANTLGSTHAVHLVLWLDIVLNNASGGQLTIKVKYGATTLWGDDGAASAQSSAHLAAHFDFWLFAAGATNAQQFNGSVGFGAATPGSVAGIGVWDGVARLGATTASWGGFSGTSAIDSTSAATFAVTVTQNQTTSDTTTPKFAVLEYVP